MARTRKLAAIMFTDIQGYTALMQQDEVQAIQYRDKHRKLFNSTTEKYNGKILQYYGDGTLSIFDSAIDAVKCGIEMQHGFLSDPSIPVRIGIHTGDIIFSDEEIIGDGVNIASRIESLAVPGSVFISEKVYDEIKNQASIHTARLRTFRLKNVTKPIEVFAISNVGLIVPSPEDIVGKTSPGNIFSPANREKSKIGKVVFLFTIAVSIIAITLLLYLKMGNRGKVPLDNPEKSIAVLAFDNMSGDPDQEYFSDGVSEEILNALTNVNGLKVAGRTSSFSFKGKDEDIRSIGEKLDVKMVLEGSIRKAGSQVRITAQLINVEDGFHLWSETFDRQMEDIFAIQDEIAAKIVQKLKLQFMEPSRREVQTQNPEAYDLLLKGVYFLDKDFEGTKKAMDYFKKAVELDPGYATAYALIGDAYTDYAAYGFLSNAEAFSNARIAAQKAISLNIGESRAHKVMAYVHLYYDWDWEGALSEYNLAIEYGMNDPDHFITFYDMFVNEDFAHAIHVCQQILEKDPVEIQSHWHLGLCYYMAGRNEEAIIAFNNALELDPNYSEGYRWKGTALSSMQKHEEAISNIEKALEITNGEGPAILDLMMAKIKKGEKDEVVQNLNQWINSGVRVEPMAPAILYALLGNEIEAFKWLEKSYQERSLFIITLKILDVWDPYRDDPRFIKIFERMHFPE